MKNLLVSAIIASSSATAMPVAPAPKTEQVVQHSDAVREQKRKRHIRVEFCTKAFAESQKLDLVQDRAARSRSVLQAVDATLAAKSPKERYQEAGPALTRREKDGEYIRRLTNTSSWRQFSSL